MLSLLVAFGVSFEVPLIAIALNLVGVLSYEVLRKSRRWIFFLTIVFAAFVTPTQDPFTMLLMAGPMIVLFELAIQIARHRRQAAGQAGGRSSASTTSATTRPRRWTPARRRWTTPLDSRPRPRAADAAG